MARFKKIREHGLTAEDHGLGIHKCNKFKVETTTTDKTNP